MSLTCRPARLEEIRPCFTRLGDTFAYEPALRRRVPEVWSAWLREGMLAARVIEDHTSRGAVRVIGFGAWVFVSDAFAAELRRAAHPYLRAALVQRWLEGERVVLGPDEVRAANAADGLTVFFINDPLSNRALPMETLHLVEGEWGAALYELRACRLREMFWEVNSARLQRWAEGCGLRLRSDWDSHWKQNGGEPPEDMRPHLVGLTRDEALKIHGSHASQLFLHAEPRFGFTARQQELVSAALQGETDDKLALSLHVSLSAIKKRWIATYERIDTSVPGWLERDDGANGSDGRASGTAIPRGETRGVEKRRRLLNYLRQHPEELHFANARRA